MKKVEIYYKNLNKETQEDLLKLFEVKTPEQMNWDIFPLEVIQNPFAKNHEKGN